MFESCSLGCRRVCRCVRTCAAPSILIAACGAAVSSSSATSTTASTPVPETAARGGPCAQQLPAHGAKNRAIANQFTSVPSIVSPASLCWVDSVGVWIKIEFLLAVQRAETVDAIEIGAADRQVYTQLQTTNGNQSLSQSGSLSVPCKKRPTVYASFLAGTAVASRPHAERSSATSRALYSVALWSCSYAASQVARSPLRAQNVCDALYSTA
jgi:hypothetical protein